MAENEINGNFRFDQDSKRYHRFQIETEVGVVGTVYVPKKMDGMPKKLILVYAGQKELSPDSLKT